MTEAIEKKQTAAVEKSSEYAELDHAAENLVKAYQEKSPFTRAMKVAKEMTNLERALTTEKMTALMTLQNSPIGFMTDKPEGGYDMNTVRSVFIKACTEGVNPIGNEFNILAGRCYITKAGMKHKL